MSVLNIQLIIDFISDSYKGRLFIIAIFSYFKNTFLLVFLRLFCFSSFVTAVIVWICFHMILPSATTAIRNLFLTIFRLLLPVIECPPSLEAYRELSRGTQCFKYILFNNLLKSPVSPIHTLSGSPYFESHDYIDFLSLISSVISKCKYQFAL